MGIIDYVESLKLVYDKAIRDPEVIWLIFVSMVIGAGILRAAQKIVSLFQRPKELPSAKQKEMPKKVERFLCLPCGGDKMKFEKQVVNDSENGWEAARTHYAGKWYRFRCHNCNSFRDLSETEAKRIRGSTI